MLFGHTKIFDRLKINLFASFNFGFVVIFYRVTDACFSFLLVWYYCTLTIREHILKVNGSR